MEHNSGHYSPTSTNSPYQNRQFNSNLIIITNYKYSRIQKKIGTINNNKSNPTNPHKSSTSTQTFKSPSHLTCERQKSSTSNISQSVSRDKRTKRLNIKLKKRLPVFSSIYKPSKKIKQQDMKIFCF